MKLRFCGAAQEVTGSNHLLECNGQTVLLDCGMIQGGKEQFTRNRQAFAYEARAVAAVVLSHAHIDHSGRLPLLVQRGYRGPIFCTQATAELCRLLLLDSAHIQEEDAQWKRKRLRRSKRAEDWVEPLYTTADAEAVLGHLKGVEYEHEFEVIPGLRARFRDAGHILGSASVDLMIEESGTRTRLVFSGDVGRPNTPILRDPVSVPQADLLIVESTYGDRLHAASDPEPRMQQLVSETVARGGKVIIPAFAIGRTQEIVYSLYTMMDSGLIPKLPVFVDSPMAKEATELTARHVELYDAEARNLLRGGNRPFRFPGLKLVETVEQSRAINELTGSCIIVSASGMCNAGRIKHHLRHHLPHAQNTVALVGYQAVGTLGRLLQDGLPEVRIFGDLVAVRAHVESVPGYSAHADRDELLAWLGGFEQPPRQTYVVHGEKEVALTFARTLNERFQWSARAPRLGEESA